MRISICNRKNKKGLILRAFGIEDINMKEIKYKRWIGGLDIFPENELQKQKLLELYKDYIYTDTWEEMEDVVARLLIQRNMKLAVAESCTGGLLSARLVNVSGISSFFLGGVVVYANELKSKLLSIDENLLLKHGAVSEEVCRAMCVGVLEETDADISVAITGIAGPGGGSKEKPVGLTYVGIGSDKEIVVHRFIFSGSRNVNRFLATQTALNLLRKALKEV